MYISFIGFFFLLIFFVLMLLSIAIGHYIGTRKVTKPALSITEGAVFTLMGLLIAFAFAGASQRLDQRRMTIIQESNAIGTAYLRLDILQPADRLSLKNDFLSYVTARLDIYDAFPDYNAIAAAQKISSSKQAKIWHDAIIACKSANITAPMLILPAINTMFDIANTRTAYTIMHPPALIFCLLILVALLSGFLTGYGMAGKGTWNSLHVIAFALIISVTIDIVIDLEYPRIGIIKESNFDYLLVNQIKYMQSDIQAENH